MTSYISPSITDPALRDTLQSLADDVDASGITISDVDPDASLTARSGRLWYNATSSNLFIFSDAQGGYVRATGEDKNYHAVRLYYVTAVGATPGLAAPQITLTWDNLTQSSAGGRYSGGLVLTSGSNTNISTNTGQNKWVENPPSEFSGNSYEIWWSDVIFQRTGGEATTISAGTTPLKHIHFSGLVTFGNNSYITGSQAASAINNNTTLIDGGKITTRSIEADQIKVGTLLADNLQLNSITRIFSGSHINVLPGQNYSSNFTGVGTGTYSSTALSVITVYGTSTSSTSVTITGTYTGTSYAQTFQNGITATGSVSLGTHVLAGSAHNIAGGNQVNITTNFSASSLGVQPGGGAAHARITHVYAVHYR